jgi:hypothetical protein
MKRAFAHHSRIGGVYRCRIGGVHRDDAGRSNHLGCHYDGYVCSTCAGIVGTCKRRERLVRRMSSRKRERRASKNGGEAMSPELNQKLAAQFPPGSSAVSLVRTLTAQGFKLTGPCQTDSTIHRAGFGGPTSGSIFEPRAEIYWKTEGDTVAWTKGFVMFVGL